MTRIVVIGDVGGFAGELARVIGPVADDPGVLVVQVGDLVDRGPDSPGVLALVGRRLEREPRHWVQLIGNHEDQYLGGRVFWREPLADGDAELLRTWWLKDLMRVATAVRAADGEEFLLTHAGLGVDAWRMLGEPVTAATAADLLNIRPDSLLWDDRGPLWADAGSEVYESWRQSRLPMPFSQIHGHSTIVDYRGRTWTCGGRIRQRSTVDWTARHTVTRLGGAHFVGVDPRHGTTGASTWAPLVLEGATLLA